MDTAGEPFVSVIIPVYNDPDGIKTTLDSVTNQTYQNSRYEVLPVDNDSTDETRDVISKWGRQYSDLITPLDESAVQGSYAARNRGIAEARGDIFVFIDADMTVSKNWIQQIVRSFETNECDYLGYQVVIDASDSPNVFERYERALSFPVESYLENSNYAPTCAMSVRRSVIESLGTFDESLVSGGDKEFGRRVADSEYTQCYDSSIVVSHPARDSFNSLVTKARRVGRGHEQFRRRHPDVSDVAHPFHPIKFLPPSPQRLQREYSGGYQANKIDVILFYFLSYILKLYQSWSAVLEYRSSRN